MLLTLGGPGTVLAYDLVKSLAVLIDDLVADTWRQSHPFSEELAPSHRTLLSASDDDARAHVLNGWLQKHQPCIFGRIAARHGLVDHCFLTHEDIEQGDTYVAAKIARSRRLWRVRSSRGDSHAFIITLVSQYVAEAEPNAALLALAQRLAELYLSHPVNPDTVYHDELFLEANECRSWKVGVNFFSPQADGRWWKDHRIPGGVAFSMNSVGHMACVRRLGKPMRDDEQEEGLYWALIHAMQLINGTTSGPSGRNTWLHPVADVPPTHPAPCDLPRLLRDKNSCEYAGLYHTDESIPSSYFTPSRQRPAGYEDAPSLDLTYLHLDSPDNPDYYRMGLGQPTKEPE